MELGSIPIWSSIISTHRLSILTIYSSTLIKYSNNFCSKKLSNSAQWEQQQITVKGGERVRTEVFTLTFIFNILSYLKISKMNILRYLRDICKVWCATRGNIKLHIRKLLILKNSPIRVYNFIHSKIKLQFQQYQYYPSTAITASETTCIQSSEFLQNINLCLRFL